MNFFFITSLSTYSEVFLFYFDILFLIDSGSDSDNCSDGGSDCGSDIWSTLIFQGHRMGKEKGVVSSFWLVPENIGIWSLLQVGDRKFKEL
jgi:hypothetical protein